MTHAQTRATTPTWSAKPQQRRMNSAERAAHRRELIAIGRREAMSLGQMPDFMRVDVFVVAGVYDVSEATVYARVKEGTIPAPVSQGRGGTRWAAGDIKKDLTAKAA